MNFNKKFVILTLSTLVLTGCANKNASVPESSYATTETPVATETAEPTTNPTEEAEQTAEPTVEASAPTDITLEFNTSKESYTIPEADIEYTSPDLSEYQFADKTDTEYLREINADELISMFDNGYSGIVFIGYPGCFWCQRGLPVYAKMATKLGANYMYYVNVSKEENSSKVNDISEKMVDYLDKDESGTPALYVPFVVGIRNGKVTSTHLSLVDDFVPESNDDVLNASQQQELEDIYEGIIASIAE